MNYLKNICVCKMQMVYYGIIDISEETDVKKTFK